MNLKREEFSSPHLSQAELDEIYKDVQSRLSGRDNSPSEFATPNDDAVRQIPEEGDSSADVCSLPPFREDIQRILSSKEFERLSRKTQVVTSPRHDHISSRMHHCLMVSEISAYVARCIGANEDLARAIGLGHDIGHSPLGHTGEMLITGAVRDLGREVLGNIGVFKHNIHGVNVVDRISYESGSAKGSGLNLTDQVRHGILSHDGERLGKKDGDENDASQKKEKEDPVSPDRMLTPEKLDGDIERYIREVIGKSGNKVRNFKIESVDSVRKFIKKVNEAIDEVKVAPATIEACIVLFVDSLHYLPEDFEDMISLGVLKKTDLPLDVVERLGTNKKDMIRALVTDLLIHSYGKDVIGYSDEIAAILASFKKDFLYPRYGEVNSWIDSSAHDPRVSGSRGKLVERMKYLFEKYLRALRNPSEHPNSSINKGYLDGRDVQSYMAKLRSRHGEHVMEQMVVDYIAGFTDRYFFEESDRMFE